MNSLNIPGSEKKRVVIIGAGFGGLALAKKLVKSSFQVVLIDRNNFHQFQPLFYQVAMAGLEPSSIAFPLRKLFQNQDNIHIRVAEFDRVDATHKVVFTDQGSCIYDVLVFATGVITNFYGDKQLEENVYGLKSIGEALGLRNAILQDYESALLTRDYEERQRYIDIVIVGGGPTGVELAGSLAEMKKYILPKDYAELDAREVDIYLVQSNNRLLNGMSDKAALKAEEFLKKLGVKVIKNTKVISSDGTNVILSDGRTLKAGKVIWAAGITGQCISGLEQCEICRGNRMRVDRACRVTGYDDIYALGDIAYMEEPGYERGHPQVAQVAIQQAKFLAAHLKGRGKKQFSYIDKGSMATIGRNKAVVDLPRF